MSNQNNIEKKLDQQKLPNQNILEVVDDLIHSFQEYKQSLGRKDIIKSIIKKQ